jgi:hypothetical protein
VSDETDIPPEIPLDTSDPTDPNHVAPGTAQTPDEAFRAALVQQEQDKGFLGSLEAGGKSFLNQALLGVPEAIEEGDETPDEKEIRETREGEHTLARGIGGVAGAASTLAWGGGVEALGMHLPGLLAPIGAAGEAIARGIVPAEEVARAGWAANTAAAVAKAATEGALYSSPVALTQAAFGDPKQAAETLLWGVGAGAVIGGGVHLFGEAGGALRDKAVELAKSLDVPNLDEAANMTAAGAAGATSADAKRLGPEWIQKAGAAIHDLELLKPGMTRQELGDAITTHLKNTGNVMNSVLSDLDSTADDAVETVGGNPINVAEKFLHPGDLGDAIRQGLDSPQLRQRSLASTRSAIEDVIADANDPSIVPVTRTASGIDVVKFSDAQDYVSSLRKQWLSSVEAGMKGKPADVTVADQARASAYMFAKRAIESASDDVAAVAQKPELTGALAQAKTQYAKLATLEDFAQKLDAVDAGKQFAITSSLLNGGRGPMHAAISGIMSTIGSGVGGALGGFPGAIVGHAVGKVAAMPLAYVAKRWAGDQGMIAVSMALKRAANSGDPNLFAAVLGAESRARLQDTMARVGDVVQDMAIRGTIAAKPSDHMASLLDSTSGLSKGQQYDKLAGRLNTLASSPAALAQAVGQTTAPLATTAPDVAAAYNQAQTNAVQYLAQAVPRSPTPPQPMAPNTWTPSPSDKLAFHDKAEIVANPMRAIEHMQAGTLSDAHVDALRTIYPSIYGQMRTEILKWSAAHPDAKLPMRERASVSKFLGTPMGGPGPIQQIQSLYANGTQTPQPPGGPAKKTAGPKATKLKSLGKDSSDFGGQIGAGSE